jgi:hypothetical protein
MRLESDPRWVRLNEEGLMCSSCRALHKGLLDLGADRPSVGIDNIEIESNQVLRLDGTFLSEDFCVVDGKNFMIRTVLELPVLGADDVDFGYGVWSSLSRENFDRYVETFNAGDQEQLQPMFSWFMTRLHGYPDTFALKSRIHPRNGRQRPLVEIQECDNPLYVEQREGVSFDRILDIYAMNGHDLRSHF